MPHSAAKKQNKKTWAGHLDFEVLGGAGARHLWILGILEFLEYRGAYKFPFLLFSVSNCWSPPWVAGLLSAATLGTLVLEINGNNDINRLAGFSPVRPCPEPSTRLTPTLTP